LEALGLLVGRQQEAEALATRVRTDLASLAAGCADSSRESVMVVLWDDPPMTAGGSTWMSQLLEAACLANVFADVDTPWPTVSMEAVVARQPHWLLTSRGDSAGTRLAQLRADQGWARLEAVRQGRIIELDPDLLSRSGPAMAEWVRAVKGGRGDD
ncbi:MAG TPA: ABC transporter substrate-binding protein, partial [Gemmatimonadales bacterium]|nr:ABC transporter substrate-binding protein [Gemmatimonadales bacterium]